MDRFGTSVLHAALAMLALPDSTSKLVMGARSSGDADAGRGVALRVEVEDQHLLADGGQRGAEVDGGGGLADAALLVGDGKDAERAGHGSNPSIWVADRE